MLYSSPYQSPSAAKGPELGQGYFGHAVKLAVTWCSCKSTLVSPGMSVLFKHDIRSLFSISSLIQAKNGSLNPLDLMYKVYIANFLSFSAEDGCAPLEYPQV